MLHVDAIERTNSTQELERRPIAAEENVLAVVDEFSRFTVAKRGRSSAQLRSRVDDKNAVAPFRQRSGGAQASEACADDRDGIGLSSAGPDIVRDLRVDRRHHTPNVVRTQVIAAMTARSGLEIRTTRENTS